MSAIKLCHLIDTSSFNPLLYNSIKYSDREKIEYTVISLQPEGDLQKQMRELGVRSFSMNHSSRKQAFATLSRLYRIFRREKFQIVQAHLLDSSLLGLTAAKMARVPVRVFSGHHSHESTLDNRELFTFVDSFAARSLSNLVISPSRQMKEIFIESEHVPSEKIAVVPHGFDLDAWRRAANNEANLREELGLNDKIVFGAVGRLFWVKKIDFLIDSFAEVCRERDDMILLIVGDGPDREMLMELVQKRRLEEKILFIGRRSDVASVMKSFDVLIHPSLTESFGMIFIEALALGKPVITSKVGIAADIIKDGETGFLFEAGNKDSLVKAIENMLGAKDQWQEMGERGRIVAEEFEVRKTQAQCDELYLESSHVP